MAKCDFCEKEVLLPFECKFCGGKFCVEHRLVENHSCLHAPSRTPLGPWKAKTKPCEGGEDRKRSEPPIITEREYCPNCRSYRKQAITYGEKFEILECLECGFEWKYPTARPPEHIVGHSKINIALVFAMIATIAISSMVVGNLYIQNTGLENKLTSLRSQVSSLQSQVSSSYESGYEDGYDAGYIQGVEEGVGRGFNIRDPTYDEAIAFIAWDETNENEYSENYTCHHFTADFKNNAFQAGYRCGYVAIDHPDSAHAIVCFNTTDYGVIFVEPQYDDSVNVTIGHSYSDINGYQLPDYDDTIVSFTIIW